MTKEEKKKPKQVQPEPTPAEDKPKYKQGQLDQEEADFILSNIGKMKIKDIAAHLNRRLTLIYKFLGRHKVPVKPKIVQDDEIDREATLGEAETYSKLKNKAFYKNLRQQLTNAEMHYFVDHWIDLVRQFNGDLAPSEEMELKELLILEILKNRETASEFTRLQQAEELQRQLREEMALDEDRDKEKIQSLTMQISQLKVASSSYIRNFKDLCDRAEKMRKALHASRQDRVKHLEDAKVDFVSYLKLLEERGEKMRVGREMEIIRAAKKKEERRLAKLYLYSDGKVDRPVTNEETIKENSDVEALDSPEEQNEDNI